MRPVAAAAATAAAQGVVHGSHVPPQLPSQRVALALSRSHSKRRARGRDARRRKRRAVHLRPRAAHEKTLHVPTTRDESWRDAEGSDREKRARDPKVLKVRRSPRERGRMGTSVSGNEPPCEPNAFESVPTWTSTPAPRPFISSTPHASTAPPPVAPHTSVACASSTISNVPG
eukprot:29215-Pelagococcus_subviridis.AAC.4